MTREEALKIIRDMAYLSAHIVDNGVEAYEFIEQFLSKPSLSSNLDEAVIPESEMVEWMKYGPHTNYPWCDIQDAIKITAEHFFARGKQAGAEWMARQGVTLEGCVCKDEYAAEAPFYYVETENSDDLPIVGDKVVVQIRKKV